MKEQLSFVLPVTLKEKGLPSNHKSWRSSPDEGSIIRTRFLLLSFVAFFKQADLREFVIVCPEDEVSSLSSILRSVTPDLRYSVVAELTVCAVIGNAVNADTGEVNGWIAQQLIKLAIATHISSEYFVTLDSDIICTRPFSYHSLICKGLSVINVETLLDYQSIYREQFSILEWRRKSLRYRSAAELLGYSRPDALWHRFYGETPVVLHSKSVLAMAEHLEQRFHAPWLQTLAVSRKWTEYSLYFQFLELTNQLDSVCALAGCNTVLDLQKSIWHGSDRYRCPRLYDRAHFANYDHNADGGFFVAVQSWLPISSWLPQNYCGLSEFYADLQQWILH